MNKVFLVGRLARDPDLRTSNSGLSTMRCAIAVDRQFVREGDDQKADFINIVAFGNRAETMKKYLTKGSQIAVDGRIQTGSYDGQDGKKVYTTDVIIDNFQFLDSKGTRISDSDIPGEPTDSDFSNNDTTDDSSNNNGNIAYEDFGNSIELDNELPF